MANPNSLVLYKDAKPSANKQKTKSKPRQRQRRPQRLQSKPIIGKSLKRVDERYKSYAELICNPAACPEPLILPDYGSHTVDVRRFTRIIDVDQADYPSLKVVMNPNLHQPGFITCAQDGLIPSAGPGELALHGYFLNDGTNNGVLTSDFKAQADTEAAIMHLVPITYGGVTRYGFHVVGTATVGAKTFNIRFTNIANTENGNPRIKFYNAYSNAWHTDFMTGVNANGFPLARGTSYTITGEWDNAAQAMGFDIDSNKGIKVECAIQFNQVQAETYHIDTYAPAFQEQAIDQHVTKMRLTAMSMLISNTSSAVSNGGSLTIARVPHGINHWGALPKEVSKLPTNRYMSGPAALGGYCFWMPRDQEEWAINDVGVKMDQYKTADFIAAELTGWPAGASAKITFTWVVEFYTENQLFAKHETPIYDDRFGQLVQVLNRAPAAFHNPDHESGLASVVASIGSYAKEAARIAKEYGPIALAVLEALGSLAV